MMRWKLPILLFGIFFCMCPVHAGKIYKWTDENGRTHYGEQPPNLEQGQLIKDEKPLPLLHSNNPAETERKATSRDFAGHFSGVRLGQTVHMVFSRNGHFVESVEYKRSGYTVRNMRSYAGTWSFSDNRVEFSPSFQDHGSNFIAPPGAAVILSVTSEKVNLIWHDKETTLARQYGRSHVAFPEWMR